MRIVFNGTVLVENYLSFLRVADLLIKVRAPVSPKLFSRFDGFSCESLHHNGELEITYLQEDNLDGPCEVVQRDSGCQWVVSGRNAHEATAYITLGSSKEDGPSLIIDAKNNWSHVNVRFSQRDYLVDGLSFIASIIFRNRIIFQGGVVLHAAAVVTGGKVILFTAPSGTGKSTQAKLWATLRGAEVLNDDSPCLKIKNDQVIAHGTPWSGSKDVYVNDSAPVDAIVVLEQAANNVVRKLEAGEASALVLPRFFLPYQDARMMEMALATTSSVLSSVPAYHLQCRPDEGAVELVEQCLGL